MNRHPLFVLLALAVLAAPSLARADARLISVVPTDGGCVVGPSGPGVQHWDVAPGKTYEITIDHVVECANNGTDPTLNVRVKSSSGGNTDLPATLVVAGTYKFTFTLPENAVCTMPIQYCTTPGDMNTGIFVRRNDGDDFQAHLRVASFGPGCSVLNALIGGDCAASPTRSSTWAKIKSFYR
jgi:hypothetical protein